MGFGDGDDFCLARSVLLDRNGFVNDTYGAKSYCRRGTATASAHVNSLLSCSWVVTPPILRDY